MNGDGYLHDSRICQMSANKCAPLLSTASKILSFHGYMIPNPEAHRTNGDGKRRSRTKKKRRNGTRTKQKWQIITQYSVCFIAIFVEPERDGRQRSYSYESDIFVVFCQMCIFAKHSPWLSLHVCFAHTLKFQQNSIKSVAGRCLQQST